MGGESLTLQLVGQRLVGFDPAPLPEAESEILRFDDAEVIEHQALKKLSIFLGLYQTKEINYNLCNFI